MRVCLWIYFCLLLSIQSALSQKIILNLRALERDRISADYQITSVWLGEKVSEPIGEVFYGKNAKAPVFLQRMLDRAILDFYAKRISVTSELPKEIEVGVLDFQVEEKFNPALQLYEGTIDLKLRFTLLGKSSPIHLLDFKKEARYQRSFNAVNKLEELVNAYFNESVEFFDHWMKEQAETNPQLAGKVEIKVLDTPDESSSDTVFFHMEQPLQWSDFRDRPNPSSRFNAVISNSFSIQGKAELVGGVIVQTIHLKVFMLPGQSWTRDSEEYGINHERRHFELTRIIADQFKKTLLEMPLDAEFFQAQINDAYFEYYRKLTRIQLLYDQQTAHGLNQEAQGKWNLWIRSGLVGEWEDLESALAESSN